MQQPIFKKINAQCVAVVCICAFESHAALAMVPAASQTLQMLESGPDKMIWGSRLLCSFSRASSPGTICKRCNSGAPAEVFNEQLFDFESPPMVSKVLVELLLAGKRPTPATENFTG